MYPIMVERMKPPKFCDNRETRLFRTNLTVFWSCRKPCFVVVIVVIVVLAVASTSVVKGFEVSPVRWSSISNSLIQKQQQQQQQLLRQLQRQQSLIPSRSFEVTSSALFLSSITNDKKAKSNSRRRPSKVVDEAGPTPIADQEPIETIRVDDIPELRDASDPDDLPYPIPYQPWRRGDTAGCEDPIDCEWRQRAEELIYKAVTLVGGTALDVTWYLTAVLITIDDEQLPDRDYMKSSGPVIEITEPTNPLYYDPNDPEPEEIWDEDDDILYLHQTPEEAEEAIARKRKMYAPYDPDLDGPLPQTSTPTALNTASTAASRSRSGGSSHTAQANASEDDFLLDFPEDAGIDDSLPLYKNEETRADIALKIAEDESDRYENSEQADFGAMFESSINVDTAGISIIAEAILNALETEESSLRVLERHEVLLAGPCRSAPDIIETQKQFNAYRNAFVIVQTVDPFQSNRILKGQLVDRNSMDLILNKKGRMVTIPLNFVQCVRLASIHLKTASTSDNYKSSGGTRSNSKSGKKNTKGNKSDWEDDNDDDDDYDDDYDDDNDDEDD